MKASGIDPLILDAGDIFFSTSKLNDKNLKSEIHRAKSIINGYEKIGCNIINVGHYEVLNGLNFLEDITQNTEIPFISANLRNAKSKDLLFQPYKIFKRDGLKIGVIGVTSNLPDTSTTMIADNYIDAGNNFINTLSKDVDVTVLLANCTRSEQSSLNENFPNADFIIASGSTNMTRSSNSQASDGPLVYSCGKQGKYLITADLTIKDKNENFVDITAEEKKINQINKRFERLQKKDPNKTLEQIYADQSNVLKLIEGYKEDEIVSKELIKKAVNKLRYKTIALNQKIGEDPAMLKFVNSAVSTCEILNPKSKNKRNSKAKKSPLDHSSHDGHNH